MQNGKEYLISITEFGTSVGNANYGKFAYLLTDSTREEDWCKANNVNTRQLAGIDHAFMDAGNKFYRGIEGAAENVIVPEVPPSVPAAQRPSAVVYMDETSMPTDVKNGERINEGWPDQPIPSAIPDNAIWKWQGTGNVGSFTMSKFDNKNLCISDDGKLCTGTGAAATWTLSLNNDLTKWEGRSYDSCKYYFLMHSVYSTTQNYYLHCDYWNFNVKRLSPGSDDLKVTVKNNNNYRVDLYEKTKVYLDVKP